MNFALQHPLLFTFICCYCTTIISVFLSPHGVYIEKGDIEEKD